MIPDMEKSNSASSSWSTFPKSAEIFATSMCGFHHYNTKQKCELSSVVNPDFLAEKWCLKIEHSPPPPNGDEGVDRFLVDQLLT